MLTGGAREKGKKGASSVARWHQDNGMGVCISSPLRFSFIFNRHDVHGKPSAAQTLNIPHLSTLSIEVVGRGLSPLKKSS
jgi:hypothetical protein